MERFRNLTLSSHASLHVTLTSQPFRNLTMVTRTSSIGFSLHFLDFGIFFLHLALPTMWSDIFAPVLSISLPSLHCWHVGPTFGLIFNLAGEHLGRTRQARWPSAAASTDRTTPAKTSSTAPDDWKLLRSPPLMTPTRRCPWGPPRQSPRPHPSSQRRPPHHPRPSSPADERDLVT
jgi:hypothetical protein